MKILMLTEYFYPQTHGGTEWSVYYLAKQLIGNGIEVGILTPNYGNSRHEVWQHIEIYRFPFIKFGTNINVLSPVWFTNPLFWLVSFWALTKTLGSFPAKIIHVQSKSLIPAAIMARILFNKKVIVTLRDYYLVCSYGLCINEKRHYQACTLKYLLREELPQYIANYVGSPSPFTYFFHYLAALNSRFISRIYRLMLNFSDQVIAISNKQRSILELNQITIDDVIYNTTKFYGPPKNRKQDTLLFIGRLTPGKGALLFVEAIKQLRPYNKTLKGLIIGKGLLKEKLEQIATTSKIPIDFLDTIPYKKMNQYYQETLLTVVPSVWEEPFGRVALESIAHGVPVIVSRRGGLPEIVKDRFIGFVAETHVTDLVRAIKKGIVQNKQLRKNIKEAYPFLIQKFYMKPTLSYLSYYEDLL